MTEQHVHLTQSEEYQELLAARKKLIWPLLIMVIGTYTAFILTVAFAPATLGTPMGDNVTSVGIALGVVLIFFMFGITLYYVKRANRDIEPLIAKLQAKAEGGQS